MACGPPPGGFFAKARTVPNAAQHLPVLRRAQRHEAKATMPRVSGWSCRRGGGAARVAKSARETGCQFTAGLEPLATTRRSSSEHICDPSCTVDLGLTVYLPLVVEAWGSRQRVEASPLHEDGRRALPLGAWRAQAGLQRQVPGRPRGWHELRAVELCAVHGARGGLPLRDAERGRAAYVIPSAESRLLSSASAAPRSAPWLALCPRILTARV